jgi:hypothetical protein
LRYNIFCYIVVCSYIFVFVLIFSIFVVLIIWIVSMWNWMLMNPVSLPQLVFVFLIWRTYFIYIWNFMQLKIYFCMYHVWIWWETNSNNIFLKLQFQMFWSLFNMTFHWFSCWFFWSYLYAEIVEHMHNAYIFEAIEMFQSIMYKLNSKQFDCTKIYFIARRTTKSKKVSNFEIKELIKYIWNKKINLKNKKCFKWN